MTKLMIDYFNQDRHDAFMSVITEKVGANFHLNPFPRQETGDLTWGALNAKVTNLAAAVQTYGSEAKIVKRDDMVSMTGNINPIEISYLMDEKLLLNRNNPRYKNMVLDGVYNDSLNAYNAVNARMDFITMQQLSKGTVVYDSDNNSGGVIQTYVDYDLESWQEVDVSTAWSTAATATPLSDIRTQTQALQDRGINPDVVRMTRVSFNYMIATTEVKTTFGIKVTKGIITSGFLSLAEMNVFMESKDLPIIEIVRDDISYEKADGTFDNTRRGWAEGIVQFGFNKEGRSLWVEPIEYTDRNNIPALVTLDSGIIVQKYSKLNPPAVVTLGKGIMFPAWDMSSKTLLLDTTP